MRARHLKCNTCELAVQQMRPAQLIVCSSVSTNDALLPFTSSLYSSHEIACMVTESPVAFAAASRQRRQDTQAVPKTANNVLLTQFLFFTCQAVKMLHEEVGSQPEGTCGDMLVLPIYAALPPQLQVRPPCCSSSPTMCTSLVVNKGRMS